MSRYERMKELSDKLADVVIEEADPDKWPGAGIELGDLTRDDRGDRYWCKKNAAATLSILTKVFVVVGLMERRRAGVPANQEDDYDLDKEQKDAEREAARILERAADRAYGR